MIRKRRTRIVATLGPASLRFSHFSLSSKIS